MNSLYCGPPPLAAHLWSSWNLDPVLLLAFAAMAYMLRQEPRGLAVVAVLLVAFVSPLCALSSALFSARVVHHVLIIAVAAPLLSQSLPIKAPQGMAWPFAASTLILWFWHLPVAYDLALSNTLVYWVMQLSLLGSATWFWHAVLAKEAGTVAGVVFIIASFSQMGMLGALLTFSPFVLYAAHALAPFAWGMTPLQDQQLGGMIMWVPAGLPYAAAAVWLARRNWALLERRAT